MLYKHLHLQIVQSVILLFKYLQNIFTPKPYERRTWNCERMFTSLHSSHITCHASRVICHLSHVTCHMLHPKKITKKHVTRDMWHMTRDMWHVTRDMWHMTCDTWHVTCDMLWGLNIVSKFQLPSSYGLWFMIFWRFGGKGSLTDWPNELITKVFAEQPWLHRVCY